MNVQVEAGEHVLLAFFMKVFVSHREVVDEQI